MKLEDLIYNAKIPLLDAELIAAQILNISREQVISSSQLEIEASVLKEFKKLEKKRLKNYPLAYLLGKKDFYNLSFKVNKHVLVPRPETEQIIDYVLNYVNTKEKDTSFNFLDIGTGSGAIIISLADALKKSHKKHCLKFNFIAADISSSALKLARKNILDHGFESDIISYKSDLLKSIPDNILKDKSKHLVICANLPYLSTREWRREPSISREPKLALHSKDSGLRHYRELFKQINSRNISNFLLICEINPQQKNAIEAFASSTLRNISYESFFLNDHSKRIRFFIIKAKK